MEYTKVTKVSQDETAKKIGAIFSKIERKARLSGNTALLIELDRIPNLVLGLMNQFSQDDMDKANTEAMAALEKITESVASNNENN